MLIDPKAQSATKQFADRCGSARHAVRESPIVWQIGGAFLGVVVYGLGLFALRTFSSKEIHQAREGIAFVSPFVASWAKKLKGDS